MTPQPKTGELLFVRWIPAGSSPASSEAQYESGLNNQSIVSTRKDGFPAITGTKIFLPALKTSSLLLTSSLLASECQIPSPAAPGSPHLRPGEGGCRGSSAGGAATLCGHFQFQATLACQVVEATPLGNSGLSSPPSPAHRTMRGHNSHETVVREQTFEPDTRERET